MRRIVHLSDLHFGSNDAAMLAPLTRAIQNLKPDLIAVSGDLTQRARSAQFREARAFLDDLPFPRVVVPGNHDVPLFNLFNRFIRPLEKYRRHFDSDLEPSYRDGEIAVLGLNTAHAFTIKGGRITDEQLKRIEEFFSPLPQSTVKILVTHHPFDVPEGRDADDIVGRAAEAMRVLAHCQADFLLSGHLHRHQTSASAVRYKMPGHSALIVQAGTAVSTRTRGGEGNSFNVLEIEREKVSIATWYWEKGGFSLGQLPIFFKGSVGWKKEKPIA